MATADDLTAVLREIMTAPEQRAAEAVASTTLLDADAVARISDLVGSAESRADVARALGDELRASGEGRDLVNECYRAAFYGSDAASRLAANPLYAWFLANRGGRPLDTWPHYFVVYDHHLSVYRGTDARVLEIGTHGGGGLDLLRDYFGPTARLVGADLDPGNVEAARARHVAALGDQSDPDFLRRLSDRHGPFDVVIDNGGHTMEQQITTAEVLLPLMADRSVLLVEDTHTSYRPEYGGGLDEPHSFVSWLKRRIDDVNAYHWSRDTPPSPLSDVIASLHVYDSVVVVDKVQRPAPFAEVSGSWDLLSVPRQVALESLELEALRREVAGRDESTRFETPQFAGYVDLRDADDNMLRREIQGLREELEVTYQHLRNMRKSGSWRLTAPLRRIRSMRGA
ncbi:MAG TPA: class I SAM-dependent methyltransferase [Candidatus Nanopelagicales bacterium]